MYVRLLFPKAQQYTTKPHSSEQLASPPKEKLSIR
jgi:hypothetical protein